jgi:hypothetical protein
MFIHFAIFKLSDKLCFLCLSLSDGSSISTNKFGQH